MKNWILLLAALWVVSGCAFLTAEDDEAVDDAAEVAVDDSAMEAVDDAAEMAVDDSAMEAVDDAAEQQAQMDQQAKSVADGGRMSYIRPRNERIEEGEFIDQENPKLYKDYSDVPYVKERTSKYRSASELATQIEEMSRYIGSDMAYIPKEADKDKIYSLWSEILADAKIYRAESGDTESALYYLAELYRQGENLGVRYTEDFAKRTLARCLNQYPSSQRCLATSTFFHLTQGEGGLQMAESDLLRLREQLPSGSESITAGTALLHYRRGESAAALEQIQSYMNIYPNGVRLRELREVRRRIEGR